MVIPDRINPTKERLRKVLKLWSLHLIIYLAFFIYRFYLIPRPETRFERNPPSMVIDLLNSPISTLPRLVEGILKDLVEILYSAWSKIISPEIVEVTRSVDFKSILIALLVGFGLFIYLRNLRFESHETGRDDGQWFRSVLTLGNLLTLLGPIPAWETDQFIHNQASFLE